MNNILNDKDVRNIVTADAEYAGNVMRIPQDIQQKARQLCWKYNMTDPSDGEAPNLEQGKPEVSVANLKRNCNGRNSVI